MDSTSEINVENGNILENGKEVSEEKLRKEEEEEEEELSMERQFERMEMPSWRKQLSVRAFGVSFLLSVLFTCVIMKLNLTSGIIPSLNISAAILGFFFVKIWTKVTAKFGMLTQPFTRQENTVIQTCVTASSGIAFSGKIPVIFPELNICKQSLCSYAISSYVVHEDSEAIFWE